MSLSMKRWLQSQQGMLSDFPVWRFVVNCQQLRLPWPLGDMLLEMKVSPHCSTSPVGTHGSVLLSLLCCSAWPMGKGWSLSSLGSHFSWEETGDDRTGVTAFHTVPCEVDTA